MISCVFLSYMSSMCSLLSCKRNTSNIEWLRCMGDNTERATRSRNLFAFSAYPSDRLSICHLRLQIYSLQTYYLSNFRPLCRPLIVMICGCVYPIHLSIKIGHLSLPVFMPVSIYLSTYLASSLLAISIRAYLVLPI